MHRSLKFWLLALIVNFCFLSLPSYADEATPPSHTISETELRALIPKIAPKVAIFAEIWKRDPKAILYGGTSRDFIYWILNKLRGASSPEDLQNKINTLLANPIIDIREIVGSQSDIDVISAQYFHITGSDYGIKKIDRIDPERLDIKSDLGRTEIDQGYIPIEKIQISQTEVITPPIFGNGIAEILSGNLSVHFSDDEKFWKSYYAAQFLNHPALLAIRYLRLRALHWYNMKGSGKPEFAELLNFDPTIKEKIKNIFSSAISDPKFIKLLQQEQGLRWLNSALLKSFRSYTNPTAAYELFKAMGFKELQSAHPKIESINQFLFIQNRNPAEVKENLKLYRVDPEQIFISPQKLLPGLKLLHGTKTDSAFRAILFQNVMPSEGGTAGAGLYGVDRTREEFARNWGGSKDRIVVLDIDQSAKIIDVTEGLGKKLFDSWCERNKFEYASDKAYDQFANDFGADILRYPYTIDAFVVKNSEVLIGRKGLYKELITLSQAMEQVLKVKDFSDFAQLMETLKFNSFSNSETSLVLKEIKNEEFFFLFLKRCLESNGDKFSKFLPVLRTLDLFQKPTKNSLEKINTLGDFSKITNSLRRDFSPNEFEFYWPYYRSQFKEENIEFLIKETLSTHVNFIEPLLLTFPQSLQLKKRIEETIKQKNDKLLAEQFLDALFIEPHWQIHLKEIGDLLIENEVSMTWFIDMLSDDRIDKEIRTGWIDQIVKNGKHDFALHSSVIFKNLPNHRFASHAISWINTIVRRGEIDHFLMWTTTLRKVLSPKGEFAKDLPIYEDWIIQIIKRLDFGDFQSELRNYITNFDWHLRVVPNFEGERRKRFMAEMLKRRNEDDFPTHDIARFIVEIGFVSDEAIEVILSDWNNTNNTWFEYLTKNGRNRLDVQKKIAESLSHDSGLVDFHFNFLKNKLIEDKEILNLIAKFNLVKHTNVHLFNMQIEFYKKNGLNSEEKMSGALNLLQTMQRVYKEQKNNFAFDTELHAFLLSHLKELIEKENSNTDTNCKDALKF